MQPIFTDLIFNTQDPDQVKMLGIPVKQQGIPNELCSPQGAHRVIADQVIEELSTQEAIPSGGRAKLAGMWFRVTKLQSELGIFYKLRRIPDFVPTFEDLIVNPVVAPYLTHMGLEPGLYLFAGPMGAGKTTAASATLGEWLTAFGGIATTIEQPPEYPLEKEYRDGGGLCIQLPVNDDNWETPFKDILRSSSKFILVGELREPAVAALAVKAASKGAAVIATIHASSIVETMTSLEAYCQAVGLTPKEFAPVLNGVFKVGLRQVDESRTRTILEPLFLTQHFMNKMHSGASSTVSNEIRQVRRAIATGDTKTIEQVAKLQLNFLNMQAQRMAANQQLGTPNRRIG